MYRQADWLRCRAGEQLAGPEKEKFFEQSQAAVLLLEIMIFNGGHLWAYGGSTWTACFRPDQLRQPDPEELQAGSLQG